MKMMIHVSLNKLLIIISALVFLHPHSLFAEMAAQFDDFVNPTSMIVYKDHLYVVTDIQFYIYSISNYKLMGVKGTKGEGPGEFLPVGNNPVSLVPQDEVIIVRSLGKLSYFSQEGGYLREIRVKPRAGKMFAPFGNGYVGMFTSRREDGFIDHGIAIYDKNFRKTRIVYQHRHGFPLYRKFEFNPLTIEPAYFKLGDGKIFVLNSNRDEITVYNQQGSLIHTIDNIEVRRPFTEENKRISIADYQRDPYFNRFYHKYKKLFKYPKYFPPISWFYLDRVEKRLYLSTHMVKENEQIILVYDFQGNSLGKIKFPYYGEKSHRDIIQITQSKLYQLVENDNEESWQLYVTKID